MADLRPPRLFRRAAAALLAAAMICAPAAAAQAQGNAAAWREAHQVAKSVHAAVEADRTGAAPDQALRPVRALSAEPPPPVSLVGGLAFRPPSPRVSAYRDLTAMGVYAAPGARPSAALIAAALADWEAEVARLRDHPSMRDEALLLAERHAEFGDLAGARRAADLHTRTGPLDRIEALTAARAWDEAVETARNARGQVAAADLDDARERLITAAFAKGGRETGRRVMLRLEAP